MTMTGKLVREIDLPESVLLLVSAAKKKTRRSIIPLQIILLLQQSTNLIRLQGDLKIYKKPAVAFNSDDYESEQIFYNSKDGTRIPMIITYKKGTNLNGKNPTMLYGYGGFNISETPGSVFLLHSGLNWEEYMQFLI